jgi:hypothetical protein
MKGSSHFMVAHSYVRESKTEHCNSACTFASKILLADKLQSFRERVKLRMKNLKELKKG